MGEARYASEPHKSPAGGTGLTEAVRIALSHALAASPKSGIGVFRAIVGALALPPEARALDIGCGTLGRTSTLRALVDLAPGEVIGLERNAARIEPSEARPPSAEIRHADAAYYRDRERFDLVCLDLDLDQVYETLSLIAETVPH